MLIRLIGHYIDNPNRIDKLIAIKGLPEEWFFRQSRFGRELIKPWEPDVEANIPRDCRHLCEPIEFVQVFAPVEKGREYVVDTRIANALRFDYVTEQGQTMWDQIERYLERTVPRDKMVPKPVLVAPDHKSSYSPHEARRSVRGSLELRPAEVPFVDLTPEVKKEPIVAPPVTPPAAATAPVIKAPTDLFACEQCSKSFKNKQALGMHTRFHIKKVAVGV